MTIIILKLFFVIIMAFVCGAIAMYQVLRRKTILIPQCPHCKSNHDVSCQWVCERCGERWVFK